MEVLAATGVPLAQARGKRPPPYGALVLGLDAPSRALTSTAALTSSIDRMLAAGWLDEVRRSLAAGLFARPSRPSPAWAIESSPATWPGTSPWKRHAARFERRTTALPGGSTRGSSPQTLASAGSPPTARKRSRQQRVLAEWPALANAAAGRPGRAVTDAHGPPPIDRAALLALYDVPDPHRPGRGHTRLRQGPRRSHHGDGPPRRPSRSGVSGEALRKLEVTALLHDIGRSGMDAALFGRTFQAAQAAGLPVRVRDFVRRYPTRIEGQRHRGLPGDLARPALESAGLAVDDRVADHVEMRMGFDRRVRRVLAEKEQELRALGVTVEPWMVQVILYYYYPERMEGAPDDVRLMGMVLVACENFEAYNNVQRARDYYGRDHPSLRDAFHTITAVCA